MSDAQQAEDLLEAHKRTVETLKERLRFETLLSDLSMAFYATTPAEVDAQIRARLGLIVEALGLDRASILQITLATKDVKLRHFATRRGSGLSTPDIKVGTELPWYAERLFRGEQMLFRKLPDELPEEAASERAYCLRQGLRSHLSIPLKVNQRLLGALTFGAADPLHEWNDVLVERLELLGQSFANALGRYQREQQLEVSETRLQLCLAAAEMGTWEWDITANKILWSKQVAALYGLPLGAIPQDYDAVIRLAHPDDRPSIERAVRACLSGKTAEFHSVHRVIWPDGTQRWLELKGKALRDDSNTPVRMVGMAFDVTERKHAEESARETQRMYENLVNTIDGIVWELDVASFKFTYVSPQAERILGYPVWDWMSEPDFWANHIHKDDRHWALGFCLAATRELRDHEFQYRMLARDGRIVWVHDVVSVVVEEGRATQLRGIMVDITERKKVEDALRKNESHFRAMFEEAPIGLAYVDSQFRLGRVNRALCEFLGYSAEELYQLPFMDITHPDDIDKDERLAERVFAGEIPNYKIEKRYLTKSGEIVWGLLTATVIRDKDGTPLSGLGMIENVTGRKEIEDQLRQAQKMDALGQLAGGVAHDFNNLLTAIKGYSEISIGLLPKDHSVRSNLEEIVMAGDRATVLTRQLLAFGRKQVRRPKVIDLSSVVDEMQKMLRRLIGENIKLVTSMESKLDRVLADPSQLEQIIVNLVVNARDAMPKGGKLTIELAKVYLDAEYARYHLAVTPGRHVMLAVSDTGCGMSRAVQQRIFEPFFTTKEPGMGTGLGLPTVYGIVKQSGGHIWVYSEEGVGTKFKIYLPASEKPEEISTLPLEVSEAPGGNETILLVEDDDSVRNMILRILRDKGYDLVVARDGQEALLLSAEAPRDFHLLLTDVIMPKMGGRELSARLLHTRPQMKVLFLSGYAHDAMVHHGALDSDVALLEKPFTKDELLHRIREVLATK